MKKVFGQLQRIGKALMLPIAVLPAAGLLLRLGAPDVFNIPFINAAGGAIFNNLALLFAIGVAVGISNDGSGAAGLSGTVGYLVLTEGTKAINSDINMGVLAGIISGLLAGFLYNRFSSIKLPDFLGFFGGKRFVPIITGASGIVIAGIFGFIWPPIQNIIYSLGEWITTSGSIGVGFYGLLNQLLIPLGLHHVLNSLVWFVFGEFTNAAGDVITGDLSRFFAGDPTAGKFMAGIYPIFMFGMPAAALAMYHTAKENQKKIAGGILFSAALTFFLTGIGEPLLFSFCFVAPALYFAHALLTGSSLIIANLLGIKHGFGFSAGLIDYVLNFGIATKPLLIIPMGIGYFIIYYFLFRFFITKFDIPTPGRSKKNTNNSSMDIMPEVQKKDIDNHTFKQENNNKSEEFMKAKKYIKYLGGSDNLKKVEACITRLRLELEDSNKINESGLKSLGASGVLKATDTNIQVVVGTKAEFIADEIKKQL